MHLKRSSVLTLIIALTGVGAACVSRAGDCSNQIRREIHSPNGTMKAVVFQRDCGATVGFNTQVSVLPSSTKLPDDGGNVFVADGGHGDGTSGPFVSVSWTNDGELLVTNDKDARVFHNESSIGDIRVNYSAVVQ